MSPNGLRLLGDLSNVLEAGLLEYNRELKSSLRRLCGDIAQASDLDVPRRQLVRAELDKALALYESGDYRGGASMLSRSSRLWWDGVAP
ncbi:hypothetical protein [Lysobacter sp. A3-1-A15]|uniref:hypothetical protein n=1 Tax=Novilysobacter viscosus TaxID=3098602 RepID=UPI002ED98F3B